MSHPTDTHDDVFVNALNWFEKSCRLQATANDGSRNFAVGEFSSSILGFLEHARFEPMPLQELVELGAIALG